MEGTAKLSAIPVVGRLSREPRLLGKVCIVSGAASGIGQGICVRLLEEGANVVLLDLQPSCHDTLELMAQVEGVSPPHLAAHSLSVQADISDERDCQRAAGAAAERFGGRIDVLVNNAALFVFHSVESASAEDWDRSAAVNIKGHALLTKSCLPYMKAAGGGSLVFLGSISSFLAQPHCATYASMKAALVQLSRSCAYDLAKYNIRSNAVCPGSVETPISRVERDAHGWTYEQWEELKTRDVMLRRVGGVRQVADAVLFFACGQSSYCTGSTLMVDGGQSACTTML